MKTLRFKNSLAVMAAVGLGVSAMTVVAQDATPAPAAAVSQPAPVTLNSSVMQVLQLSQAKVGDSTILAYIQNSGTGYSLSADQIIYLKQQGMSDAVLNAMLTKYQNAMVGTATAPATMTTAPAAAPLADASTTTYVPSTTTYYYDTSPAYYDYYASPYYYWWPYPAVSFGFGYHGYWGGGWHGGGAWHGGSGWHGGGESRGGSSWHGGGGGGWHGGGGGHGGHR